MLQEINSDWSTESSEDSEVSIPIVAIALNVYEI